MENQFDDQLPPTRCQADTMTRLRAIAARSVAKKLADHIRLAVEQYVGRDGEPLISAWTQERLQALKPELSTTLDYDVTSDEEALKALISHWNRTKKDYYGVEAGKAALAPGNNN